MVLCVQGVHTLKLNLTLTMKISNINYPATLKASLKSIQAYKEKQVLPHRLFINGNLKLGLPLHKRKLIPSTVNLVKSSCLGSSKVTGEGPTKIVSLNDQDAKLLSKHACLHPQVNSVLRLHEGSILLH